MNNISWGKDINKDNGERVMHWIPCSSRLPSENGWYLCTCKTSASSILLLFSATFKQVFTDINGIIRDDVIAWMKLPEPYKK